MASPVVRVNTFLKQKQKPFIDPLSKLYIAAACILGLNRLPIILNEAKYILTSLAVVYSILLCACLNYKTFIFDFDISFLSVMSLTEYTFGIAFSVITWKRMERYYNEINKFDTEIGCRPKTTGQSVKNIILMVIFNMVFVFTFWIKYVWDSNEKPFNFHGITVTLLHCLELFYYGHLLSLLVIRMRLINFFVETTLSNGTASVCPIVEEFESFKSKKIKNSNMKKLMDLYFIVIKAFDFLVEAVKYQLLVMLITSFMGTLQFSYSIARDLIIDVRPTATIISQVDLVAVMMLSLFSPCIFGDQVHAEVKRLRELLASRLYENELDKSGRSAARDLLALTEARNLSFTLMRILQIDISLPFKFIGLLVTYLIILLQFEKVINPPEALT